MQVGRLTRGRFLVVLPPEANRDEIVAAIPRKVWDDGFVLQPYSPVIDASISIPFFKVWLDIKGIPLELHTELHMARVVSSFGVYLGSMEPQVVGDCQTWTVFVATDDLALVPYQVEIRVGGMVHTAQICPRKWTKGQVFHRSELPPSPSPYRPPGFVTASGHGEAPPPPVDPRWLQHDEDVIPMSLKALREIFRNFSPDELPADLAACLAGDERAITANHEAYRRWDADEERRRFAEMNQTTQKSTQFATTDPQNLALGLSAMQQPTQDPQLPGSHARPTPPSDATANPPTAEATVRRTDHGANRGKRVLTDPALQVCTLYSHRSQGFNLIGWEPSDLFPEISMPQAREARPIESRGKKQKVRTPTPKKTVKPRRSTRIKINKKKNGEDRTIGLEVNDFIDIPLQHAEGIEILTAIGASNISIPLSLMTSPQQQLSRVELGQPSKGPGKRKKQSGPSSDTVPPSPQAQGDIHQGPRLSQESPVRDPATQSSDGAEHLPQAEGGPTQDMPTSVIPTHQMNFAHPTMLDEQEEDQYLDQVDYSDEDMLS